MVTCNRIYECYYYNKSKKDKNQTTRTKRENKNNANGWHTRCACENSVDSFEILYNSGNAFDMKHCCNMHVLLTTPPLWIKSRNYITVSSISFFHLLDGGLPIRNVWNGMKSQFHFSAHFFCQWLQGIVVVKQCFRYVCMVVLMIKHLVFHKYYGKFHSI